MSREEIAEDSFSSDEDFDEDSDSGSSSDVDAKLAEDDVFDTEFFKCYSALKKKDDKIYDKNVKFFDDNNSDSKADNPPMEGKSLLNLPKKSNAPKMTILDHQLKFNDADMDDQEQSETQPKIDLNQAVSKSFYQKELEEIKNNIKKIGKDIDRDSDDELLVVKGSEPGTSVSKPRRKIDALLDEQLWNDPTKLSDEDKFLRDYIVNKRYISANVQEDTKKGFFSSNLEDMSDAGTDEDEKKEKSKYHVDQHNFDKISRIPRNSTKTIRDLVEKRKKKEKRMKRLEKEKKRKKALKDADCEDIVGGVPTKFRYREIEPVDYGLSAEELLMDALIDTTEPEPIKKKKHKKRGLNHKKSGVAPDRLLAYGLSKTKLKKSKLL